MPRVRLDVATTVLAVSGVVGALALVGIFIVYLTDNRDSPSNAPATALTGTTTPAAKLPSGTTAKSPAAQTPAGKTTAGNAPAGKAPAGKTPAGPSAGKTPGASAGGAPIAAGHVLVTYKNRSAGYSFKYPRGWNRETQPVPSNSGFTSPVGNAVHVFIGAGPSATPSTVVKNLKRDLAGQGQIQSTSRVRLNGLSVVKTSFTHKGNPPFTTIRYVFSKAGKLANLDLTSPQGVDNAAVYQRVAKTFRWQ